LQHLPSNCSADLPCAPSYKPLRF